MEDFLTEYFFDLEDFAYKDAFQGCSYVWEALGKLTEFLDGQELGKIECPVPEGVHLENPELISIGAGTKIEPGAFIRGPCLIGQACEIRHGAYVRGYVIAGDRCVIGHDTEIKSSILLNDVSAGHFNYVGDSILGNRVNLGAGVKLANLRLDKKSVPILHEDQKIFTQLKKLGALIGDGAQIGCNAVTNPGAVLGKRTLCAPCEVISGYISSKLKQRQKR